MTDIPEDILNKALDLADEVDGKAFAYRVAPIAAALLSERRKQIERDAKIAEDGAAQHFDAYRVAAAIRAQEPKP